MKDSDEVEVSASQKSMLGWRYTRLPSTLKTRGENHFADRRDVDMERL